MARATRRERNARRAETRKHRGEEIELGPEADQRRNSGEREEEHEQHRGQQRIALVQAEEGVELVGARSALYHADDAECADGGQAVGEDVVEDGLRAARSSSEKNARPSRM